MKVRRFDYNSDFTKKLYTKDHANILLQFYLVHDVRAKIITTEDWADGYTLF